MALLWGLLGGTVTVSAQENMESLTFQDAVQACMEAISSGDLETAADLFQSLDSTFGAEDEYLAKEAQSRILPLKGLAELGAGRYVSAADTLDALQEAFPQMLQGNASLLYGLAQAHKGAGNRERARAVLERYVSQFSGTVEAGLAFLERMDLFFQEGLIDEGLAALDQFTKSNALDSLKMQGQLKAVQAGLDAGRMKESTEPDDPYALVYCFHA
jgi:tetratricopeptide (TPR) repeat protein